MEFNKNITWAGLILSFTAGFADTLTFTQVNELFSAHVTGNFVVFAYDLINHAKGDSWIKLLSFPVFIFSVILATYINKQTNKTYRLLVLEGLLLTLVGFAALVLSLFQIENTSMDFTLALIIVFAMGFQNAFGRFFLKATHAPTTVMTGNVTQAAIGFAKIISRSDYTLEEMQALKNTSKVIASFMIGCCFGGFMGSALGLPVILLPGLVIGIFFWE